MPNLSFDDIIKTEKENFKKRLARVEAHKPLVHIATEYGLRFSKKIHKYSDYSKERCVSMTAAFGTGCVGLALNLYLGENDDIIRDVGWLIEDLKGHPKLEFRGDNDYIEAGWKGWDFGLMNAPEARLLVRCWFENSNSCKVVGTGEFEEKKKVICG